MNTYVALLRGINVGGNNMVSMKSLKASFEKLGFDDVTTYINSGNIIFRASESDARKLETKIDRMLSSQHDVPARTVVRSLPEMARLLKTIGRTWKPDAEWRYNVVFLRHTIDSGAVLAGIETKPDIEHVVYCPGTLLWSGRIKDLTRTAMVKLASKPIYKDMTVRNLNTTTRVFEMMQRIDRSTSDKDEKQMAKREQTAQRARVKRKAEQKAKSEQKTVKREQRKTKKANKKAAAGE